MTGEVIIYGLFDGDRCIYVGKTRNLTKRMYAHNHYLKFLGRPVVAMVLQQTTLERGSACERRVIRKFRKIGQAEFNRQYCRLKNPKSPKKVSNKAPLNLSIPKDIAQAARLFVIENRAKVKSLSAWTEQLWISFLKSKGENVEGLAT